MKTPELEQMLQTMEKDGGINREHYCFILGSEAFKKYESAIIDGRGRLNGLQVGRCGDGPGLSCLRLSDILER